jgi:hypothetical protein
MGWVIHVEIVGKKKNAYRILVEKSESYRPLGRPRNKFEGVDIGLTVTEWGHGLDSAG